MTTWEATTYSMGCLIGALVFRWGSWPAVVWVVVCALIVAIAGKKIWGREP